MRVFGILTLELSEAARVELRLHRGTVAVRPEELVADRLVWMEFGLGEKQGFEYNIEKRLRKSERVLSMGVPRAL